MRVVRSAEEMQERAARLSKIGIGFFLLIAFILNSFQIVDTGHRGVRVRLGAVTGRALPEGIHFKIPLLEKIVQMDIRVQKLNNKTSGYSSDAQVVEITSTLNYSLTPDVAQTVYQTIGVDWEEKLILQILEGTIKETTGQYKAVNVIAEREQATTRIQEILKTKLAEKSILLSNFEINNLDFDNAFEDAVKNKVIAVEQAKEAQNKTVRIKEESQQKIIQAQAEAESMSIRAQALSQNKNLVEYEAVKKWDGKLPQYNMGGSVPFINIGSPGKK